MDYATVKINLKKSAVNNGRFEYFQQPSGENRAVYVLILLRKEREVRTH